MLSAAGDRVFLRELMAQDSRSLCHMAVFVLQADTLSIRLLRVDTSRVPEQSRRDFERSPSRRVE